MQTYSGSVSSAMGHNLPREMERIPLFGSVPTKLVAGRIPRSLQNAIDLELKHNPGCCFPELTLGVPVDNAGTN